jgi:hypothetical protein
MRARRLDRVLADTETELYELYPLTGDKICDYHHHTGRQDSDTPRA